MSKTLSESAAEILKASMSAAKDPAQKLPAEQDDLGGVTNEKPEGDDVGKKAAAAVGEAPKPGSSTVAGDKKMNSVKSASIAKPVVGSVQPGLGEETESSEEEEVISEIPSINSEELPVVEAKHEKEEEEEEEEEDESYEFQDNSEESDAYINIYQVASVTADEENSDRCFVYMANEDYFYVNETVESFIGRYQAVLYGSVLTKFYELVDEIERKHEITIHTTTIDPWNELTEEFKPEDLGREDKYLSRILGLARKNARKTNRHNCIINHVRDQPMVHAKTIAGTEISYFPIPSARDFAGGQVWFRKGLSVLIPWRPPKDLLLADGTGAQENEVHLKVAKSKPKGVSKNGTYKMYLDLEKYQYYMIDAFGRKIYANRNPLQKETVSNSFPVQNQFVDFNKKVEPDIVNGKELIPFSQKIKDMPF